MYGRCYSEGRSLAHRCAQWKEVGGNVNHYMYAVRLNFLNSFANETKNRDKVKKTKKIL